MMATRSALEVASDYVAALAARDSDWMNSLRAPNFVLEFVHRDAFQNPLSVDDTRTFWPNWFVAFPELDVEVTRTIAAEEVVVTQWIFTGTNTGPLEGILGQTRIDPTRNTIHLRGASFFDIRDGLIQHETIYIDVATLMVELGVEM